MPNWVYNKVSFYGEKDKIKEMKDFMTSEENPFDFNRLIPMPESLKLTSGSDEVIAISCAEARRTGQRTSEEYDKPWAKDRSFDEWADLGDQYLSNKEKYGATTWYDWCCRNWGTKWNACDAVWHGDNHLEFNTAWSAPIPVYKRLSELFPDVSFEVDYADEDLGSNCGKISWDEEESFFWEELNDFGFACDVWGWDPEEMREEYYADN